MIQLHRMVGWAKCEEALGSLSKNEQATDILCIYMCVCVIILGPPTLLSNPAYHWN